MVVVIDGGVVGYACPKVWTGESMVLFDAVGEPRSLLYKEICSLQSKNILFCSSLVAAILGVIAAATGFAGEVTKVKASEVHIVNGMRVYPKSPALALGIVSIVFLIIIRIYLSVSFGVSWREHPFGPNDVNSTPISKLLHVFSWVASLVAMALIVTAIGLHSTQGGEVDSNGYITCDVMKPGIFAAGAIFCLLSAVVGIGAYITSTPPPESTTNPAVAYPVGSSFDLEKNQVPFPPQQYPPQKY
ncbi:uncharacterized protein LOC143548797 [Bidens hawaiensis]|uniref:uncharacterized protein LOC143548797 n=1 Tax=Bidens hawaiensis TaxID=980011 RepID=UPI004049062B